MWVVALVVAAAAAVLLVPQNRNDREGREGAGMVAGSQSRTPHGDTSADATPVGTSGTHDGAAETEGGTVVQEIETITGANDGMTLIGRRVDLHVDVQSRANDYAFWVGSPDNKVLVVLGRDNRNGTKRQSGVPAGHALAPVRGGQRAGVSGVIRGLPKPEEMASWNLTTNDKRELAERKIYIRADRVTPEGHGSY
jgi:hypothetical protein